MGVALLAAVVLGVLGWRAYESGAKVEAEVSSVEKAEAVARDDPGPRRISRPFKPGKLPDVDARQGESVANRANREAGAAALRMKVPGVQIDLDPITGGPKNITAPGRFLKAAGKKVGDAYEPVR